MTRYRLRGAGAALGFISLPLFIPDIVLGMSLLLLLGALGLPLSLAAVVLGHLLICVPFALTVLIARFEGFDSNLEEASADLGEDGWMTFWRVTFPLMLPGIIASLLLTFITSFDEFLWPISCRAPRPPCRSISGASCAFPSACPWCWRWAP